LVGYDPGCHDNGEIFGRVQSGRCLLASTVAGSFGVAVLTGTATYQYQLSVGGWCTVRFGSTVAPAAYTRLLGLHFGFTAGAGPVEISQEFHARYWWQVKKEE
jgi:hypothetical protein